MEKDEIHHYKKLRKIAQGKLDWVKINKIQDEDFKKAITELNIHQVELELQNQELLETQEQLEETRDDLHDLYEFAPVGYITMNHDGVISKVNLTMATMIGVPRKEIIHTNMYDYIDNPDKDDFFLHLRKMFTQNKKSKQSVSVTLLTETGEKKEVQMDSTLRKDHITCRTAIIDITEKKKAQRDLQEALDQLAQVNQKLEQKIMELENTNHELEAFTYSASHDLQAPLRSISGFSEILLEDYLDQLDEQGKEYLSRIQISTDKMTHLIDALLKLSRVHRATIKKEHVNLSSLAQRIIADLKEREPDRTITIDIKPNLTTFADKDMMKIVLDNLLGNAWKFTRYEKHPTIQMGETRIDDDTTFYVKDNGAGFDSEFSDKLFAPFQRLHNEQEFSGTGIGLPLAARIISRHNGRIWAESEEGNGAIFYFLLHESEKAEEKNQ